MNNLSKWVLKKRSIWFHIIVGYLSCGIWAIIYFYFKKNNQSNKQNILKKDTQNSVINEYNEFTCKLEKTNKYDCHSLINTLKHFEILDNNDVFGGYTVTERSNIGGKFYESDGTGYLSCIITWDNNKKYFSAIYNEHSCDYFLGLIPEIYNEQVNEIINNRNIKFGGIKIGKGYFESYDLVNQKITKGYDECEIELLIRYI